jgi:CDP-paratose 2-epimerase
MKTILVTGGAGFVGSSLAISIKVKYPQYEVICMDNLKRRGSELNLPRLSEQGIQFVHGDIRNREDFHSIPNKVSTLIEASAEPSVLAGINGSPDYLLNTNLVGTINCLDFAVKNKSDFIFLSTSRVYPIEEIDKILFEEEKTRFVVSKNQTQSGVSSKGISEKFSIEGYRSLYGATKLSSELLIAEFGKFYGLKTVVNRCGVLTGPWQMGKVDQGFIVLWLAKHFWNKKLGYFGYGGTGKQVRDILHVNDLFRLVDYQMHQMEALNGRILNVGGGTDISVSLLEFTEICKELTGHSITIDQVKENRTADIRIYITDNSLVTQLTGWSPQISIREIAIDVYNWMKANENKLKPILE